MKFAHVKNLKGKKRYFVAAFLAVEIASLPAAAQIFSKVAFQARPIVTAVEIPTFEVGQSRFLVVSNAPFTIRSADMIGEIDVSVHKSGDMNGRRFGDNAQMPGPASHCASLAQPNDSVIYQAKRKTAAAPGSPVSQAVIVVVKYDESAAPQISFAKDNAAPVALAPSCASAIS